ncbi:hypothetical protein [Actinokineospora pegani]|uniref:hypothetical protein n=1 Tax=Actinokineospora pegani TaxID=2654637 RepID=UPI001F2CACAD|nr:hypothetical protein [Actinokineospora pegani]
MRLKTWHKTKVVLGLTLAFATGLGVVADADARQDDIAALVRAADREAAARGTIVAISFYDRVKDVHADNGELPHKHYGSASLVKLFIADDLYHRHARGEVQLSDFDWQQADAMLRSSDDKAASRFWSAHGGPEMVNRVKARYRLTEVQPPVNARWWGLTRITSSDISNYYARMLAGEGGLPQWLQDKLVGNLQAFTSHGADGFYQRHGVPDGLPNEPVMGVKQGWMCCQADLRVLNSSGVVGQDRRFIVVILAHQPAGSSSYAHVQDSATMAIRRVFPGGTIPRPGAVRAAGSPVVDTPPQPATSATEPRSLDLARLDGAARGAVTMSVTGLGELVSPVTGRCTPRPGGADVEVTSADGAKVTVRLGERSSVTLADAGLDFDADLLPGDYAFAAPRLTMGARLQSGGAPAGRLDLDVTCA